MAMISTIYGERDESLYEKRTGIIDDENETTEWVEYWDHASAPAVLVHRSAHTVLKPKVQANSTVENFI